MPARQRKRFTGVIRFESVTEAQFNRYLAGVARDAEKRLADYVMKYGITDGRFNGDKASLKRLAGSRVEIDRILERAGINRAPRVLTARYRGLVDAVVKSYEAEGIEVAFREINARALRTMAGAHLEQFSSLSLGVSNTLRMDLARAIASQEKATDVLSRFADALKASGAKDARGAPMFSHLNTLARDALSQVSRRMTIDLGEQAGIERWQYFGPVDGSERDFCARLMQQALSGKTWTRAMIERMDNGQTGDVLLTGGGFNCRHEWLPVPPES